MNDHQCSSKCRREGCPNCPHGKGDEEHCDVCDAVTKASETPCTHEARTYDSKGYWKCKCGMIGN